MSNYEELEFIESKSPLLVVLSGPSGVGKDTVIAELKKLNFPFHFVVTATTRQSRPGEVHGKDYWFYTPTEFDKLLQMGELLENAVVYGNSYGVPKDDVRQALNRGEDTIMRIDVQGAAHIKRVVPGALFIFLAPPNFNSLLARLGSRNTETPESLERRLNTFHQEMKAISSFDYMVINYDQRIDITVKHLLAIIEAEKLRTQPRRVTI